MAQCTRLVRRSLLEDERIAGLDHEAWRLYASLLLLADKDGNVPAHPAWLHGAVFWARDVRDVATLLSELRAAGLIITFGRERKRLHLVEVP